MKILSPAGNLQSLEVAVNNGADEIYFGVDKFNARNNLEQGFTLETLKAGVEYCHLFGVKALLAVNILFSNEELISAVDLVVKAYNLGVDAFIIQDLGLADILSKNYPEVTLHASTQMGVHNLEGVKFLEKFGFTRVVLARETPLSEIKRIKENSNIELEYFAHGALCVSFSGNCYISSYLHNASGNRGKCKQLCRLPYTLKKGDKTLKKGYLLSAKDFNMINRLADLEKAGVSVIKIEGRARRAFYVATVTRAYKRAVQGLPVDTESLNLAFNRGSQEGYFNGNGKIISTYQSHIGVPIGCVKKVNFGNRFNQVFIESNKKLSPKSSFKFFENGQEKTTITAYDLTEISNGYYKITTTHKVAVGSQVNLIVDYALEAHTLEKQNKLEVDISLTLQENKPITARVKLNGRTLTIYGQALQSAKNQPLTQQDLRICFNKNEYFLPKLTANIVDSVFMPKTQLNEFRRQVYDNIYSILTMPPKPLKTIELSVNGSINKLTEYEIVTDIKNPFTKTFIIYSPEEYLEKDIQAFADKCRAENKKPYLYLPNFALESDIAFLKKAIEKTKIGVVVNNYYALGLTNDSIIGGFMNVYNSVASSVLNSKVITAEILRDYEQPFMTLRHCPIKTHVGGDCKNCKYEKGYTYCMDNGETFNLKRKKITDCTFYLTKN